MQAIIITGASRGFGKSLIERLFLKFKELSADIHVAILIARSEKGLETVKAELLKSKPNLKVECLQVDMSVHAEYRALLKLSNLRAILNKYATKFDKLYLIHNAGKLFIITTVFFCVNPFYS